MSEAQRAEQLAGKTRTELLKLATDPRLPDDVQAAARDALTLVTQGSLGAAVGNFERATADFSALTDKLVALTEKARAKPGGVVGFVAPILQELGAIHTAIAGVSVEALPAATSPGDPPVIIGDDPPPAAPAGPAPPPGATSKKTKFSDIAGELVAMFDSATIDPTRLVEVDKRCATISSHRNRYEEVARLLANGIPWYFIGLLHMLESNCNFGTHLHNGDSLMDRTHQEPPGRPPASVGDPPFDWTTSALDALTFEKFADKRDWSLAQMLYRLETYNGFGYRFKGVASPYLWGFSDRYIKGKFIRDHVFDPDAVTKQCGTAVMLKRLIQKGTIARP